MKKKIDNQSEQKLKLQFITSDEVWDKVLQFKIKLYLPLLDSNSISR